MTELLRVLDHPSAPSATLVTQQSSVEFSQAIGATLSLSSQSVGELVAAIDSNPSYYSQALVSVLSNAVTIDWHLDVLVQTAAQAAIVGIVIDPLDGEIPNSVVALADRLKVAIVVCDDPAKFHSHCLSLLSEIGHTRRSTLVEVLSVAQSAQDLEHAVLRLEELMEETLYLIDSNGFDIMGRSLDIPHCDFQKLAKFEHHNRISEYRIDPARIILTSPIRADKSATLHLGILTSTHSRADVNTLTDLLYAASLSCAHVVMRTRLMDSSGVNERRDLIEELILSDPENIPTDLRRRVANIGWDFSFNHSVVRILCSATVDIAANTRPVMRAFEEVGLDVSLSELEDGWVAWYPVPSEKAGDGWQRAVRKVNRRIRQRTASSCGISSVRRGLSGFIHSVQQATDVARIAINRPQSGYVSVADDLGLDQLLLSWTSTEAFTYTTHELLGKLENAGQHLTGTLLAYLDAESSIAETAAVLGIHRNTVAERVRKIESILGLSLNDPDTRLALHLATRVHLRFKNQD